ncbi:MAG: BolA family protein [Gammaproteobacteria bacterium]
MSADDRIARIESRLRATLAPDSLDIMDESAAHAGHEGAKSGGGHYALTIVSPRFAGQSTLARHRLVYQALGEMMQRDIHALQITALTPDEL